MQAAPMITDQKLKDCQSIYDDLTTRCTTLLPTTNGTADLQDAHTLGLQFADAGFHRRLDRATAEPRPLCPGSRKTRVDSLADHAALELREHT
jgi:hypothetical protein